MDKYKATKVLTKELVKHNGQLIISDQNYMKKLFNESEQIYAAGNPVEFREDLSSLTQKQEFYDLTNGNSFPNIEEFIKGHVPEEANYLFDLGHTPQYKSSLIKRALTPYSIIGSKEIEDVKRLFYKNYDLKIREAVSSLGIKDYFELYMAYSSEDSENIFQESLGFSKFRQETVEFLNQITYDKDNEVNMTDFKGIHQIDSLNSTLKKFSIDFSLQPRSETTWIKRCNIENLIELINKGNPEYNILIYDSPDDKLIHDFYRFAFEMPYEDQNIEANKGLLEKTPHLLDMDIILLREFQGKHFKEYFEVLNAENQKRIVWKIKNSGMENTANNSFLWSEGFKEVNLDHMNLYMEDADGFIEYFQTKNPEEKKIIIRDVLACDHTNSNIENWLNENEIELIREASFSDNKNLTIY